MPPSSSPSFRVAVAAASVLLGCAAAPAPAADDPPQVSTVSGVIRFLEERVTRDPDDMIALNRLSAEYLRRFRETGDDADLDRSFRAAEQSLKAVPAEVNAGGLAARSASLGHAARLHPVLTVAAA